MVGRGAGLHADKARRQRVEELQHGCAAVPSERRSSRWRRSRELEFRSSSNSPYLLLGVAGALVGGKIADVLEVYVLGAGPFIGAVLGAAFFVIGWRQSQQH